ncbi:MAG: pantothenate kinase, partial [Eubacteriales bacterium]
LEALARDGNLQNVDLLVGNLTAKQLDGMSESLTAANFGNIGGFATNSDIALGLFNMVYETVAMMTIFTSRSYETRDIVLTGNLTTPSQASAIFSKLAGFFNVNFIIPPLAQFATVIGAALSYAHL